MYPKISIVMTFYNNAAYIKEAIEHVLHTDMTDYEFILVDDASSDGSREIVEQYAKDNAKLIVITHEQNAGPAQALKTALKHCKGKYIMFNAADDNSKSNRFSKIVEHFERHEDVGIIISYASIIDPSSRPTGESYRVPEFFTKETAFFEQLQRNYCLGAAMAIKNNQQIFAQEHFLTLIDDYQVSLDYLLAGYKIDVIREELIDYRVHNNSVSSKHRELWLKTQKALREYDINHIETELLRLTPNHGYVNQVLGIFELSRGNIEEAKIRFESIISRSDEKVELFKVLFYLGVIYYKSEAWLKALECWEKAYLIDQSEPTILNNLAVIYIKTDKKSVNEAMQLLSKSTNIEPNYLDVQHNINHVKQHEYGLLKITERILQHNLFQRKDYLKENSSGK